jgi:hypothetical protein
MKFGLPFLKTTALYITTTVSAASSGFVFGLSLKINVVAMDKSRARWVKRKGVCFYSILNVTEISFPVGFINCRKLQLMDSDL